MIRLPGTDSVEKEASEKIALELSENDTSEAIALFESEYFVRELIERKKNVVGMCQDCQALSKLS